jgi:hypothetical protein
MITSHKKPSPVQYMGYDKLYIDGRWETGHSCHVLVYASEGWYG